MKTRLDTITLLLVAWSVAMSVCAQLGLRHAMSGLGDLRWLGLAAAAATEPWVWLGILFYLSSTVTWLIVLSRIDLAVAYPLGSSNYVFVTLLSVFWLGEEVPPLRWLGTLLVLVGIVVVARGERKVLR